MNAAQRVSRKGSRKEKPGGPAAAKSGPWWDALLPIVYEDEWLLAVPKPAGLDLGGLADSQHGTMLAILSAMRPALEGLLPVNRLARYESGLVPLARNRSVLDACRSALRSGKVGQRFWAVVRGRVPGDGLHIDVRHGSSRGRRGGRDQRTERPPERSGRKTADGPVMTRLELVKKAETRSLVICHSTLETTHALRAQLRAAGHRLVGDLFKEAHAKPADALKTALHLGGLQLRHPVKDERLLLKTAVPDFSTALHGRSDPARALHAALVRRMPLLAEGVTDAYRLISGDVEDARGCDADRFGQAVIIYADPRSSQVEERARAMAEWYGGLPGVEAVWVKTPASKGGRGGADEKAEAPAPVVGRWDREHGLIRERDLHFVIRPTEPFAAGLFPDQRENRHRVRKLAAGKDVLNLFAYTCGFSVAAAAGQARSTVSVDISPKALSWGKENFRQNGLLWDQHEFVAASAPDYLRRAAGDGRHFDMVIVDAPTFAHGRSGRRGFAVERDLGELIGLAVAVLSSSGHLLLAVNARRLTPRALRETVRAGLGGRRFRVVEEPPLPVDFAQDPQHSRSLLIQVE